MLKDFLSQYLSFTRKERTGIVVILVLVMFFILLPFLFPYFVSHKEQDHTAFEKDIAQLKYKQADSPEIFQQRSYGDNNYRSHYRASENKFYSKLPAGELFNFDPNTLSPEGWKKLGVRDKTVNTILNYVSKGGKFKQPEDIGKIWGLHEDEVQRLLPYVSIKKETPPVYPVNENVVKRVNIKPGNANTPVDINLADTSAFIALPGIGSKLANRIINFRDKLGGFYKTEQVAETFALPDSTFQLIKKRLILSNPTVKQININTATFDELKIHPYIRYNLANAIVQYRTQHGKFAIVGDVKKIMVVTEEIYNKVSPYLSVE